LHHVPDAVVFGTAYGTEQRPPSLSQAAAGLDVLHQVTISRSTRTLN
jgi:hypothetical protein